MFRARNSLPVMFVVVSALWLIGCGSGDANLSPDDAVRSDSGASVISPAVTQEVHGTVRDGRGLAIAEAVIAAEGPGVPEIVVVTNASGQYVWALPVGTFKLTVFKDGYASQTQEVMLNAGEKVTVDFVLVVNP